MNNASPGKHRFIQRAKPRKLETFAIYCQQGSQNISAPKHSSSFQLSSVQALANFILPNVPLQSALLAKDDEPGDDFSFQSTTRDIIAQAWRKKAGEVSSKLGGFLGDNEVTSAQKNASKSEIGHRVTALPSGRPSSILQLAAEAISALESEGQYADTFYVTDLGAASALYRHIARAMPRVTPHYAVKCFPEPIVMATLAAEGAGFDCASAFELELVLSLGVSPSRVIFANPCKRPADLKAIAKHKVPYTTFDSVGELQKIASMCPDVGAVLRIRADDPTARMPFGAKYGALLATEVPHLLATAVSLGVTVAGISFHVGSGAGDPLAFRAAISQARTAWSWYLDLDPSAENRPMLLDLGGGLSGGFNHKGEAFVRVGGGGNDEVALAVNAALDDLFPAEDFPGGLTVISEPGRYFAESSSTLITRVMGKRVRMAPSAVCLEVIDLGNSSDEESVGSLEEKVDDKQREEKKLSPAQDGEVHYYISDGIYGGFNAVIYDGWRPEAAPFRLMPGRKGRPPVAVPVTAPSTLPSTFFGPTCDSLDMVFHRADSPDLEVGDWLLFPNAGAYTMAGATDFNGIPATAQGGVKTIYVRSSNFAVTNADAALSMIRPDKPPMEVKKNF